MKKLLCFLGILILLFLLVLPPVLRVVLPDQKIEQKETNINTTLSCTSSEYVINTVYKNSKVDIVIIKKINNNSQSDQNIENNEETNTEENQIDQNTENNEGTNTEENQNTEEDTSPLGKLFSELKTNDLIVYNQLEDVEVIKIDFSIYTYDEIDLSLINKPIAEQKTYYESQNFICLFRE